MSLQHYLSPQNKYFGFVWLEGIKIKVHFAGTKIYLALRSDSFCPTAKHSQWQVYGLFWVEEAFSLTLRL
jgi:hypothetical protein